MAEELSRSLPPKGWTDSGGPKRRPRINSESDHVLRKRLPPSDPRKKNDVYVTNKSDFKAIRARCLKLIESGESEIILHGLGAAVSKAINLALQLEEHLNREYVIDVQTSSVRIVDDLEPVTDEGQYETQERVNSAVHIRLFQKELPKIPALVEKPAEEQQASNQPVRPAVTS